MASYNTSSEPHFAGKVNVQRKNGEEIQLTPNGYHTGRYEELNFTAVPSVGWEFVEFQTPRGTTKENPMTLSSEHGMRVLAIFKKTQIEEELEQYIRERQVDELAVKVKQWTDEFYATRKANQGVA